MPELLAPSLAAGAPGTPLTVLLRLVVAVGLGAVVAWIYRRTRSELSPTFPATLVLLAVLIAMVTQVIGDSVARAFSLVGALSIVRFRTVVRDTQDTAFVIFAVVVGMASGASDPRIAVIGIAVVGIAAFVMRPSGAGAASTPYALNIRVATGQDLESMLGAALAPLVAERRMTAVATARQGIALEATYNIRLRDGQSPDTIVKALNRIEGVQNVSIVVRDGDDAAP